MPLCVAPVGPGNGRAINAWAAWARLLWVVNFVKKSNKGVFEKDLEFAGVILTFPLAPPPERSRCSGCKCGFARMGAAYGSSEPQRKNEDSQRALWLLDLLA